jgi:hypothetical protein
MRSALSYFDGWGQSVRFLWIWATPGGGGESGGASDSVSGPPGAVGFYRIDRRKRTLAGQSRFHREGGWQLTATESESLLTGLERGVEYDFPDLVGMNATGDSIPSNIVSVVL